MARLRVVDGGRAALDEGHREHQHERPEAEDDFHFAEQVEQAGVAWIAVREAFEQAGGERVQQGEHEQDQGDLVHGRGHGRGSS